MLTPIKPKRISDLVFEQLRDLIFKGRIKPGDQLMTERELAENLGRQPPHGKRGHKQAGCAPVARTQAGTGHLCRFTFSGKESARHARTTRT